jgi:hypothetical protein
MLESLKSVSGLHRLFTCRGEVAIPYAQKAKFHELRRKAGFVQKYI